MAEDLRGKHCAPCEGGTDPLDVAQIADLRKKVDQRWKVSEDSASIRAEIEFENYYETTAFVNAVAWIAHREDHHPDITFGYRKCAITYSTHAIGGLSENDFICAARVDALLD